MRTTSVYRVLNSSNPGSQEYMILCTEYLNYRLKILILRNDFPPVIGEVTTSQLWSAAKNTFNKTEEEFHEETRNALSGKSDNFLFSLADDVFEWRQGIWTRGFIKVFPVFEINVLSDYVKNVLENCEVAQRNIDRIEKENEELKKRMYHLTDQLEKMIEMKNAMEQELYKRFLLLLNSKKKRIRELTEKINDLERKLKTSVYDQSTDEDEICIDKSDQEMEFKSDDMGILSSLEGKNESSSNYETVKISSDSSHFNNENFDPTPSTSKEFPAVKSNVLDEFLNSKKVYQKNSVNGVKGLVVPSARKKNAEMSINETTHSPEKIMRKFSETDDSDEDFQLRMDADSQEKSNPSMYNEEDSETDFEC